jgi:hypothetical protein
MKIHSGLWSLAETSLAVFENFTENPIKVLARLNQSGTTTFG